MKELFYSFDEQGAAGHGDYRVCLGVKLGVLMNGSAKLPEPEKL
jgi:hypothetical protein